VPVFGFIYKYSVVAVNRSSPANRAASIRILKSILSKGISIMVFPEGTFNMGGEPLKEFYDGAFRVAIETQTPIKPVLFLDNYDRMHYRNIFSLTPGRCRIVYLNEIGIEGYTLAGVGLLKQKVFDIMKQKLVAYGASPGAGFSDK
jgi:1-acyl-sn-glycerol-3-phosphate acyltransferase